MAISSLDTLDIVKRLKEAGFNDVQAEAVTTVFRDVRTTDLANLATKADIERLEAATKTDIERLETATGADIARLELAMKGDIERFELAMKGDIARLELAVKGDIARLELATKADIARLESQIEIVRRDLTIRLGGMIVVATGLLLGAKFFG